MPNGSKEKSKSKLLLSMSYHRPQWGWGRQLHCHDFCELMFVKEGQGNIMIDSEMFPFKKGDIVIYNPGTMHRERTEEGSECNMIFIGISNLSIDGLKPGCLCEGKHAVVATESHYDTMLFYLEQLFAEKDQRNIQGVAIYKELLNIIIASILRLSKDSAKAVENSKTYTEIKLYLDKNYTDIASIDALCKQLYINKYYLTHIFTQRYGISPLQYLIKKRIALAKHLLVATDEKVDDIAAICGYEDMSYFCRTFKKQENITPLKFRKMHRTEK